MLGTDFTERADAVLTVVQGAGVAARTFTLGNTLTNQIGTYLIDYQVDPIGRDVQIGQAAARDYMGLTIRTVPGSLRGDGDGSITAALGSGSSNAFRNRFGRVADNGNVTVISLTVPYRLELVLTPGPGILTEGNLSRVQISYTGIPGRINPCDTAGQVFELRVIPALTEVDDAGFLAFTAASGDSLSPFVADSASLLSFKLAVVPDTAEVTYETLSAMVIAGANTGTTLTVTLPDTPDGTAEVMLSGVAAGDVVAIDAAAVVQAQATHERRTGRFLVSVVAATSGLDNPTRDLGAVRVSASHEVLPGVYALAEGKTDSARVTTPSDVIPGRSTPVGYVAEAGVFSFTVMGLSEASSRADVVIALASTLTATAMPHKYDMDVQVWSEFDPNNGDDAYYGAEVMENGQCPAATDNAAWTRGLLAAGDGCLRVTLTDGGPNDADGARNGVIHDPIALVSLGGGSGGGGGGGVMGWAWLMLMLAGLLGLQFTRSSRRSTRDASVDVRYLKG